MTSTPRTVSPGYTDLSAYAWMADGITLERGRSNPQDTTAQAGRASASLNNSTSAFTMGNGSSPYAPLQLRRPFRFRCRYGTAAGNLLSAENASFESGTVGDWVPGGTVGAVLANSAVQALNGTKSMAMAWSTSLQTAQLTVTGLTIGLTYIVSGSLWNPVGAPSIAITVAGYGTSSRTSTNATWQRLSFSFTATSSSALIQLGIIGSGAGFTAFADSIMLDEGTTLATFTTSAPPIYNLWAGFNEDWGNRRIQTTGVTRLTMSDRLARAATIKLQPALRSEILSDSPAYFYPFSDGFGTTSAGDVTGAPGAPTLNLLQIGSGGTLDFGAGAAPGPDGGTLAAFTRSSANNGKCLVNSGVMDVNGGITGITLEATVRPSSAATVMDVASLYRSPGYDYDAYCRLGISATGKAVANVIDAGYSVSVNLTGTTTLSTTALSTIAVVQSSPSAGTVTVTLYVNGVSEASSTYSTPLFTLPYYNLTVGGSFVTGNTFPSTNLFDGQLANVAVWKTALSAARLLDHAQGVSGWIGELTSARFNRMCRISGMPSTLYAAPTAGASSMSAQPTSGVSLLDALKTIAEAEQGVIYVNGSGVLTFAARAVRYAAPVYVTLDATKGGQVMSEAEFITDTSNLVNDVSASRPGGPTLRVVDATSVSNYDTHDKTITLYVSTDSQAQNAAEWIVYTNSSPEARTDSVTVNVVGYANSGGDVAALLSAEVGARLASTNLPADVSATSTVDLFIEGIRDSITKSSWLRTFTTSAVGTSGAVMVLDDTAYGRLDTGGSLAF